MKQIFLTTLILLQASISMSQTVDKPFYKKKLEPKGVEFIDTATVSVTEAIVIDASVEAVWAVLDDTPGYIDWFPGLKWAKFVNPEEKGMSAKRLAQAGNLKYYEEIILYVPLQKWGFTILESNSGIFTSVVETVTLEKISENQTRVVYKGGYEPKGLYKLMKGIMAKSTKKAWAKGLQGLKEFVEAK